MRKRLYFGKNPPKSFEENLLFTTESPYNIRYKLFASEDLAPLHYGTAMEIDLFRNITGSITINKQRIDLNGNALVVFPPQTVHSLLIHQNSGYAYVLQVSLNELKTSVDIEKLYKLGGKSVFDLVGIFDGYEKVEELICEMIEHDDSPVIRTRALVEIFEMLYEQLDEKTAPSSTIESSNDDFMKVLKWTQENFREPITLAQVAATVCLSENYFCSWFKKNGGITYRAYLNSVRINSACSYLAQGHTIQEAAYLSGFSDISYFTQLFKRMIGYTPKRYIDNLKQSAREKELSTEPEHG